MPTEVAHRTSSSNGSLAAMDYPVAVHPMDEANRRLLENVHPPSWRNPVPDGKYNLVVIGSGTAGLVAAIGAASLGGRVAIIEKKLLGGDCLNSGCVPSKAIIHPSRLAAEIGNAGESGIHVPEGVTVDFGHVMQRMRRIRADISNDDSIGRLQNENVDVYLGAGRFTGPDTIQVGEGDQLRTLVFAKAVIAVGSRAAVVPIEGLEETGYLTNETLFELTERPSRFAVIGGGPIGSEMAQAFARLGSRVILLEASDHILSREDSDAAQIVQEAMMRDGIQLEVNAKVHSASRTKNGKLLRYQQAGEEKELEVDEILLAVGRSPQLDGLNLEAAGVDYHHKGVSTDETLRTTNENIYASGDVAQKYQFTHMADATSRLVLQNALFPGPKKKLSDLVVPWCTYTAPEIAHVGLYEHQAHEQGIPVTTYVQHLSEVDRSRTDGTTDGFVKIHVKKGTDRIVGATIVASQAGEIINQITLAMQVGAGLGTFNDMIFPYPTQSEAIKKIAGQYNRTRLTPLVKFVLSWWMRIRR